MLISHHEIRGSASSPWVLPQCTHTLFPSCSRYSSGRYSSGRYSSVAVQFRDSLCFHYSAIKWLRVLFFLQLFVYPRTFSFSFWTYATLSRTEKPFKVLTDRELKSAKKHRELLFLFFFPSKTFSFSRKGSFNLLTGRSCQTRPSVIIVGPEGRTFSRRGWGPAEWLFPTSLVSYCLGWNGASCLGVGSNVGKSTALYNT